MWKNISTNYRPSTKQVIIEYAFPCCLKCKGDLSIIKYKFISQKQTEYNSIYSIKTKLSLRICFLHHFFNTLQWGLLKYRWIRHIAVSCHTLFNTNLVKNDFWAFIVQLYFKFHSLLSFYKLNSSWSSFSRFSRNGQHRFFL